MTQPGRFRRRMSAALLAAAAVALGSASGGSEATHAMSSETPVLSFDGAAIDHAVEGVLEQTTTPGAVVLLRQGDTEYLAAYGTRQYGGGDAVTVDDHFRIGSNTKTMTGTVILQLVDEGELALVDGAGRIGPLNTVFFDTLLDEGRGGCMLTCPFRTYPEWTSAETTHAACAIVGRRPIAEAGGVLHPAGARRPRQLRLRRHANRT